MVDAGGAVDGSNHEPSDEAEVLRCLRQKAGELLDLFDQLPGQKRLEGLDILQDLVSATITKITAGKVKSVKFVPVEEKKVEKETNGNSENGKTENVNTENGKTEKEKAENGKACETNKDKSPPNDTLEETKSEIEEGSRACSGGVEEEQQEEVVIKKEDEMGNMEEIEKIIPCMVDDDLPELDQPRCSYNQDHIEKQENKHTNSYNQDHIDKQAIYEQDVLLAASLSRSCRKAAQQACQKIKQTSATHEKVPDKAPDIDIKEEVDDELPPLEGCEGEGERLFSASGRRQCRYCAYTCKTTFQLDLHQQRIHSGKRLYQCEQCQKTFSAVASLKRHKHTHTGRKNYKCHDCGKEFYQIAQLTTHSVVHTGVRNYTCKHCDKSYTNSANLSRHQRIHTGEMPYSCTQCEAKYRDLSSLKLHTLKHTGEKPYTCQVCNKKFKTSSDYRRHERIHTGERNYQCTICQQMFVQNWHLKQHMRVHNNERPWPCDKCGSRFRTKASLQYHTKSHLGIKDYTCNQCQKSFSTKRYLQNHQVIHTAARPYKCSYCSARFNQYPNMKRHERIHNDSRPYQCSLCDKSFKYLNSLQYHEGSHRGEKKVCEKCGQAFKSKAGFDRHKCDPGKYMVNIMKTIKMQDLVVRLEQLDPLTHNGKFKYTEETKEKKPGLSRMPRILMREPKKTLLGHKRGKIKKKGGVRRSRNFKIKDVHNTQGNVQNCDGSNLRCGLENKYPKLVLTPLVKERGNENGPVETKEECEEGEDSRHGGREDEGTEGADQEFGETIEHQSQIISNT